MFDRRGSSVPNSLLYCEFCDHFVFALPPGWDAAPQVYVASFIFHLTGFGFFAGHRHSAAFHCSPVSLSLMARAHTQ